MTLLCESNRIVHGLWIGELGSLERLTLKSFVHFGHEFHLWRYEEPPDDVPEGVVIRDAGKILPRGAIFRNERADPVSGVGKGSLGAFSDLFRYKLLFEEGGIWADMDVTCLRSFDFEQDYVFRAHRIGVVGNLMKCPAGSALLRGVYEEAEASVTAATPWLAANEILSRHVLDSDLAPQVLDGISNADDWRVVEPMVLRFEPPPDAWYAIHWGNEFWRGLADRNAAWGLPPLDKEAPPPGGLLHELYRFHGIVDARREGAAGPRGVPKLPDALPPRPPPLHLNMLVPRLIRGGAERIAMEIVAALAAFPGCTATLYVRRHAQREYALPAQLAPHVVFLDDVPDAWMEDWWRNLALRVLDSPSPLLFTHMVTAADLADLGSWGVLTVPVIHNAAPSWLDPPAAYAHQHVPFVVAVSEAVAAELRGQACPKPVIVLRHELQRPFEARAMARQRHAIRDRHGISPDTLLIGMVGQFKTQKAYTRAVRVLAEMRQVCQARLLILGGWDHGYGSGRVAYAAACRLAVELGVIADMIMPGDVENAEDYFAAFDVFLNTSIHEGLSVALLEAAAAGCPVVAAEAGGNREALPDGAVLVHDGADIAAYVEGICRFLRQPPRRLPSRPTAPNLLPLLWALLARHAVPAAVPRLPAAAGTLFIAGNLHTGGAQRSLVNLLEALPATLKAALCILGGVTAETLAETLLRRRVPLFDFAATTDRAGQAALCLDTAQRLNVRTICFWNVPAEVKLIIASVLRLRDIVLIEVSPGPMLFDALAESSGWQKRLAFSAAAYLERVDIFVAKYAGGVPPAIGATRALVIPNGVKPPPRFIRLPPPDALPPPGLDPALAIGTCCRLVPDKRIEFLIEMMAHLRADIPGAWLTIVGGPEDVDSDYVRSTMAALAETPWIRLVGHQEDVRRFLAGFRVFVMVSNRQGCPNASLEAMAMGLPIVANRDGGIAEQVADGINGFLVDDPLEMAMRVAELLRMPIRRRQFGAASRRRATETFALGQMAAAYEALLEPSATSP